MDWQIKKEALERWNAMVDELANGPAEFDLLPVFHIFDDLFFLRALRESCIVEVSDC